MSLPQRPELRDKKDVFREQLQADIDHTFTSDATDARGLGAMDRAVWQSIVMFSPPRR